MAGKPIPVLSRNAPESSAQKYVETFLPEKLKQLASIYESGYWQKSTRCVLYDIAARYRGSPNVRATAMAKELQGKYRINLLELQKIAGARVDYESRIAKFIYYSSTTSPSPAYSKIKYEREEKIRTAEQRKKAVLEKKVAELHSLVRENILAGKPIPPDPYKLLFPGKFDFYNWVKEHDFVDRLSKYNEMKGYWEEAYGFFLSFLTKIDETIKTSDYYDGKKLRQFAASSLTGYFNSIFKRTVGEITSKTTDAELREFIQLLAEATVKDGLVKPQSREETVGMAVARAKAMIFPIQTQLLAFRDSKTKTELSQTKASKPQLALK